MSEFPQTREDPSARHHSSRKRNAWACAIQEWACAAGGAAAAEFALVLPFILLILFAILSLGLALYNYEMLTGGVRVGVRQLAISRGSTSPWTDTQAAVKGSVSPALNWTVLNTSTNLQFGVNTPANPTVFTTCTSDPSCAAALQPGTTAQIIGQYPCTIVVMSINIPGCTLTQKTQELVE